MRKPSVSELLDLLNKPALLTWANKLGLKGVELDSYRAVRLKTGTSLHDQIQKYLILGEHFAGEEALIHFMENKTNISCEQKIETEHFTGRFDIKFNFEDHVYIADFKTNKRKIYLENELQLVAYKMAIPQCDRLAIISIPDYRIFEINALHTELHERILTALSTIYQARRLLHE